MEFLRHNTLFLDEIQLGNNQFVTIYPWHKMSNYEKISIPRKSCYKGQFRILYEYDTSDLFYMTLKEIPGIIIAIDSYICEEETLDNTNFIRATIYVYNVTMTFGMCTDFQFWGTCFNEQREWFRCFMIDYVRYHCKDVNWDIRKPFLLTTATSNVEVKSKKILGNPATCVNPVEAVFHNPHLRFHIGTFL